MTDLGKSLCWNFPRSREGGSMNLNQISALEHTSHQIHEICQHWARMQGKQWLRMEDHLDYLYKMARVVGKRELAEEFLFLQGIAKHHRLTQTGAKV